MATDDLGQNNHYKIYKNPKREEKKTATVAYADKATDSHDGKQMLSSFTFKSNRHKKPIHRNPFVECASERREQK